MKVRASRGIVLIVAGDEKITASAVYLSGIIMEKEVNRNIHIRSILSLIGACVLLACAASRVTVSSGENNSRVPDPRAVEHFIDGVILDQREDYAGALLSYQEAQLYDSAASSITLAIGRDYLRLGKVESAVLALQRTLKLNPEEGEAWELLATVYVSKKEWGLAEDALRHVVRLDSNRIDPYYNLALIALRRNAVEEAIVLYQRILTLQQVPDPQVLMSLGEIYLELQRFDEAAEIYRQLIALDPAEGMGYYGLGLTKEATGDTVRAVELYEKALRNNPELVHIRAQLNRLYTAQQAWDKSLALLREAVSRDSSDIAGWLEIGEIYRQKGDSAAAFKHSEMLKQRFPDDWRIYLDAGHHYLDRSDFRRALEEFRDVIRLSPGTLWGWLYAGISLVHLDSILGSEPYLKRALSLQRENAVGNYYLGSVLAQMNRPEEAVPYLKTAIASRPDWVAAMSTLAGAYESMEMFALSDSLFKASLTLDPDNSLVLNNYSYSLALRNVRLAEALRMAERALRTEPENGSYLDTVGWIYFKLGDYDKALEYIEKAFTIRIQSAEVAEHLGDVYDRLGMKDKARDAWQHALEIDRGNPDLLRKLERNAEE